MKIKFSYFLIGLFLLILMKSVSYSHAEHYKNIKKIEMDIYRNGEIIGFSNYEFISYENILEVINKTEFEVKVLGVKLFSIKSFGKEKYENDQLVEFNSETLQNDKKKYVNLNYDNEQDIFRILGSSYKGTANKNNIVGNWWNHKILTTNSQISPLSGSIKKQNVTFISKETISLNGKIIEVERFKLKSTDNSLEDDKKLDFDIWFNSKENIILKVEYNRLGKWQYILRNIEYLL
tara:strand:+ start:1155 stop:1859 length:705 start_codon:yes stop_codon:yes gene_type:complete